MRPANLLIAVLALAIGGTAARADDAATAPPATVLPKPKPKPATKPAAKPTPKVAAAKPTVPAAAPPAPVLPPPITVPTRPVTPPTPAVVVADAQGEATEQKDGLRVTFGPGSSDLNPRTDAAIRALVHAAPPFASVTFSVVALAPGTEEDPSTPRRLSLARGLAVRSILITEGIPSTRIYVRALGANPQAIAGGPPDRADITVAGTPHPGNS